MTQEPAFGKIYAAATYFACVSRNINAIAQTFGVDTRTVRRWQKDKEWEIALQNVNYTGDRSFETQPTRDTQRDAGDTFEKARSIYIEALNTGMPQHKLASSHSESHWAHTAQGSQWARQFRWADTQKKE